MKRSLLLFLTGLVTLAGQPRHAVNFHKNPVPRPSSALVDPADRVFSDIVAGGGWETIITLVNMSGAPSRFTLTFYDDNGNAANMPLVNTDGSVSRYASIDFTLDTNTSNELVIPNVDPKLRSVWSYLSSSVNQPAIGAVAVVRSKDNQGRVISESTETLSNTQDVDFFAPYDNLEGIATVLVLVNPANSVTVNVDLSAQDALGNEIVYDRIQLPAGVRTLITLPDAYPALAKTSGKLRVQGDTSFLSAVCFRLSPSGSLAYSPIFNWSGLFR